MLLRKAVCLKNIYKFVYINIKNDIEKLEKAMLSEKYEFLYSKNHKKSSFFMTLNKN